MPPLSPQLREVLELFDSLPNDAVVPSATTAIILGVSERTVRYHPKLRRVQVSEDRYGQRVGDIRDLVHSGERLEEGPHRDRPVAHHTSAADTPGAAAREGLAEVRRQRKAAQQSETA